MKYTDLKVHYSEDLYRPLCGDNKTTAYWGPRLTGISERVTCSKCLKALEKRRADQERNSETLYVTSPGKFEGEPRFVPYFYDFYMDGCGENFVVDKEDVKRFPELASKLGETLTLLFDDNGFVFHTWEKVEDQDHLYYDLCDELECDDIGNLIEE